MSPGTRFELLPAVDIADGTAVRLVQGEAGTETSYGDPVAAARQWVDQGAYWLHVVDLDRAFGRGTNAEQVAAIVMGEFAVPWLRLRLCKPGAVAAARDVGVLIERGERS